MTLDTITQINYMIPIGDGGTITFFYNMLKSKSDSNREDAEAALRDYYELGYDVDADDIAFLEEFEWTDTTSVGA